MTVSTAIAPTDPAVGRREALIPSYLPEKLDSAAGGLEDMQRALLNILEDLNSEKAGLENGQRAALNILGDFAAEKDRIGDANRAFLNILEDSAAEKGRLEDAQRAVLNMLEDFSSERDRLEDAQRAALNILDDVDFERSKVELINQQLEKEIQERKLAQEQLVAANHELEAFTYSVAHDLRAPLRQIDGFSNILVQQYGPQLDSNASRFLNLVWDGARKMGQLVDDLLNLGRIGRQELARKPTDLNSLLQSVLQDLQPEIEGRRIDWHIGPLPTLECDPGLMRVVFVNLLSNAVKYTRRRECAVIEAGQAAQDGELRVFVRDNGAGFDQKYAHKLFGVFQRLHRAEDFEGTGVGLATVQRIIHKHGGRIWAEAKVDEGAAFFFTLAAGGHATAIGMHDEVAL